MKSELVDTLLQLNYQFYQSFADDFSETRRRLQPGVAKLIKTISPDCRILDLGCGNGELARQLITEDFQGYYLGTDFSPNLLTHAIAESIPQDQINFLELDLTADIWEQIIHQKPFDFVFCFAVLHHIPGKQTRINICKNIHNQINPAGKLFISNWQFLNSQKLISRIVNWEEINISKENLDQGDYLLDWRRGGRGLRYVHHFSENELEELAAICDFQVVDSFYSDGEGGNLSLYQTWEPLKSATSSK
jgi:2-polyprenyl-3-methyl-5-hydroxy-6-metoxy-1,4-benzoquinol methylase